MRIAAFNVENLFSRADAFNQEETVASHVIECVTDLNRLFNKATYSTAEKAEMVRLCEELNFNRFNGGDFALIRKIRGKIIKRPKDAPTEIVANGRSDWIGWAELKKRPVDEIAVQNTGRVIRDVNADIMAVVEAENRIALEMFTDFIHDQIINELPVDKRPARYSEVMLIDGNDDRGIDVGIMTKNKHTIKSVRSHIFEKRDNGFPLFSRDCPEYMVKTPGNNTIWVLPNHFKSKFGGDIQSSDQKRLEQATRTREIYEALISSGEKFVVVLGDLNDTPDREPLKPLLENGGPRDVSEHPNYFVGQFDAGDNNTSRGIGTYKLGNDNDKIDCLLLSPELLNRVEKASVFRKGAWPGSRPVRWETYEQLKRKEHVASDHHAIWADIDID